MDIVKKNIIETKNLTKRFRNGVVALQDLNIEIPRGIVVGYVGSNGAGKTTTMKIITNLIRPTSGQAFINGISVRENPKKALFNVGALIEIPGVYEQLTPYEMLSYYGRVYGMSHPDVNRRIGEVLNLLDLSGCEGRKMGSFSTGMIRRVNIAKAIFHKPKVLLLDEPVLGLDPQGIKDVRELIKDLRDNGMTVFLSSHLLSEVGETCDQIIFLDRGHVVQTDSTKNIARKTNIRMIQATFLHPPTYVELRKLESSGCVNGVTMANDIVRIGFDGRPQTSSEILDILVSLGLKVVSFTPEKATLEDYYISLINNERRGG